MADAFSTLADMLKINDRNVADFPELSDLLEEAPLFAALHAEASSHGNQHKYTKQTGAPVVGFRAINAGRDMSVSADTLVTVDLKVLDATFGQDVALANIYPKSKGGAEGFMSRETARHLKTAFFTAEKQFIRGVTADAAGFVGLEGAYAVESNNVILANTATAADYTSVWFVRSGPGHVSAIYNGEDEAAGGIQALPYFTQQLIGSNSKSFTAYVQPLLTWLGLAIGTVHDVVRLANISGGAGATLDDDLIAKALNRFPANQKPTHIVMNRRSQEQLRNSRTATNPTGAPAPFPEEAHNVPIIITEAIVNTETTVGD